MSCEEIRKFDLALKNEVRKLRRVRVKLLEKGEEADKACVEGIEDRLVSYNAVSDTFVRKGGSIAGAASFKRAIITQTRRDQLHGFSASFALNSKDKAFEFGDRVGIRRPSRWGPYGSDAVEEALRQISAEHPGWNWVVVKPAAGAGSKGVIVSSLTGDTGIVVEDATSFGPPHSVSSKLVAALQSGKVKKDRWLVEQWIGDDRAPGLPARDLKFYAFYGKVACVLEIERAPVLRYCWWSRDRRTIKTGNYDDNLFVGEGFSELELQEVEKLSRHIPVPFMRLDFLRGSDEIFFGELTPRPGRFHAFAPDFDRYLGEEFLRAEARLWTDLLAGKAFDAYRQTVGKEFREGSLT